jgi:hypothetical protein
MDAAAARETLGLSGVVTERKLRQRYRRLVLRYHPDKPRGDRERFQRINDAYRVLERHLHAGGPTDALGICRQCRRRPAWRRGLDRNAYCRDCLVYAGGTSPAPRPARGRGALHHLDPGQCGRVRLPADVSRHPTSGVGDHRSRRGGSRIGRAGHHRDRHRRGRIAPVVRGDVSQWFSQLRTDLRASGRRTRTLGVPRRSRLYSRVK